MLQAADFNRISDMSLDDLRDLGRLDSLTKDLQGDGFTKAQAEDLFQKGLRGPVSVVSLLEELPPVDSSSSNPVA